MDWFWFVGVLTAWMLLSIVIKVFHNVRTMQNHTLPSFNPIELPFTAFKALFSVVPFWILFYSIGNKLMQIQIPIPLTNIQLIYSVIVWLLIGSIMITSLMSYAKDEKIKDAYNLVRISNSCIDILLSLIFFIPQIILVNGIILGIVVYLFSIFWNLDNFVFSYICSIALVINTVVIANYLAQLEYENITRNEKDD